MQVSCRAAYSKDQEAEAAYVIEKIDLPETY
jgi:hypothetical protein